MPLGKSQGSQALWHPGGGPCRGPFIIDNIGDEEQVDDEEGDDEQIEGPLPQRNGAPGHQIYLQGLEALPEKFRGGAIFVNKGVANPSITEVNVVVEQIPVKLGE